MKKIIALLLAVLMMFSFVSCKTGEAPKISEGSTDGSMTGTDVVSEGPDDKTPTADGYTLKRDLVESDINNMREWLISRGYTETGIKNLGYELSRTENALKDPGLIADSFEALIDIVDYNSFYETKEFEVTLDYDHGFSSANTLANELYWRCALVTEYCAINAEFVSENKVRIALFYYDYAVLSSPAAQKNTKIVGYGKTPDDPRAEDFDSFAYSKHENVLEVYNSKQLWYGLERGYNVVPVEGSPAKACLDAAKAVLRKICSDSLTDEEKIMNIFLYGAENIAYDTVGEDDAASLPNKKQKFDLTFMECDVTASMIDSFFLDGALLNGHAVCHGHAQYLNVLLSIEGIEAHRYVARSYRFGDTRNVMTVDGTYCVHAFNYVKLGGDFYICDLTYTFAGTVQNGFGVQQTMFRDLGYMMSVEKHRNVYNSFSLKYSDIYTADKSIDYYSYPVRYNGKTINAYIDSSEAAAEYARYLMSEVQGRDDAAVGDIVAFHTRFSSTLYTSIFDAELEKLCTFCHYPESNIGYIYRQSDDR